jgi:hypothetical protein
VERLLASIQKTKRFSHLSFIFILPSAQFSKLELAAASPAGLLSSLLYTPPPLTLSIIECLTLPLTFFSIYVLACSDPRAAAILAGAKDSQDYLR